MAMKMTYERLKIVNALSTGPKSWTMLRLAYYGEERAKNPASTSFYNQLQKMIAGGIVVKTLGGYALSEEYKKTLTDKLEASPALLAPFQDPALSCDHATHENGGPADYGPECRDINP